MNTDGNREVSAGILPRFVQDTIKPLLWFSFALIPKNILSHSIGWLARLRLSPKWGMKVNRAFVSAFGIDMNEAEQPLDSYATIEDVFTRALKPGARSIDPNFASPADGTLSESGPTSGNWAVQVKGIQYSVAELIDPEGALSPLSWFMTIYLAPHNYHRVHSPVAGSLRRLRYIPGELWPVNKPFVASVPQLFVRNERLVFEIELSGGGMCYVVMVGALNVGRMITPHWQDFISNNNPYSSFWGARPSTKDTTISLKAGDELGTFMLGSTVVVILDEKANDAFKPPALNPGNVVMGQTLFS